MTQSIHILLVEDNPADVDLTLEALSEDKIANSVDVVKDGIEAMAYLRREGQYHDAKRPAVIFLDLNLPRKDGREVLCELKQDPELCDIPVVVLTTSKEEEDIMRSYKLHANCYISKPVNLAEFHRVVRAIDSFWFQVVALPPK